MPGPSKAGDDTPTSTSPFSGPPPSLALLQSLIIFPCSVTHSNDLLDSTRHLVQTSTPLLKSLLSHPIPQSTPQRKTLQQKLSREYQSSLAAFQKIQRIAAEKQRTLVESQKREVRVERAEEEQREHQLVELEEQGLLTQQEQQQAQAQVR